MESKGWKKGWDRAQREGSVTIPAGGEFRKPPGKVAGWVLHVGLKQPGKSE